LSSDYDEYIQNNDQNQGARFQLDFRWRRTELFFKGTGEMGKIFSTQVQVDIGRCFPFFPDEIMRFL